MNILSLDASTTCAGWCLSKSGDYRYSGVFALTAAAKDRHGHSTWVYRILALEELIHSFVMAHRVELILYEVPTGDHRNKKTDRMLGAVEYAVLKSAAILNVPCYGVTASQVKATGACKDTLDVASAVAKGKPIQSGDEADAIGVWLAGLGLDKVRAMLIEERSHQGAIP